MSVTKLYLIKSVIFIALVNEVIGECGYNSCPETDPKKLNIHVISHSHDDVGWVNTVDKLYEDEIEHIITNVIKSLSKKTTRKFTQVETYFFNRWWTQQNNETKTLVHKLVNSGQLSFANGGYCVNDEAVTHYSAIIDQMTFGLRLLDEIFGKCGHPLISWQIDPFGASKEMASLYAQMGFDGHVVNRAIKPKGEFIWRGSHDLGEKSDIFTTTLHNHYSAPNGFNFEKGNDITNENKKQKASEIVKLAQEWNKNYGNTGHVLMPFGDDFQYKNAERWFENLDKLIEEITATHPEVHIFYSNPSCYLSAVNKLNHTFTHRDNDYFPLWTGFFTSRSTLKLQDRYTNNIFQISKQLDAIARLVESEAFLNEGYNELAILQHHDAITGTSPQWTADDFNQRLFSASESCKKIVDKAYNKLLPKQNSTKEVHKQIVCDSLNMTECWVSENNENFTLIIYNPIGRAISQWVRIPVNSSHNYEVLDSDGIKVNKTYLIPVSQAIQQLQDRKSSANSELVFKANLVGVGFVTYFVRKTKTNFEKFETQNRQKRATDLEMKGKGFTLNLDNNSGIIKSIKLNNGKEFPLKQTFGYYKSNQDTIYEFCPEGNVVELNKNLVKIESKYDNGLIHEVRQHWNEWVSQTIRVYEDEEYIEFDWTVGPVPIGDDMGKEVITRFETDLNNDKTFYTDANGRQMVKRTRTAEPHECFKTKSNISANYYPIKNKIFIRDESKGMQITVLTDRSQGGSSLTDGQLELMIQRRLTHALYIGLNETGSDKKGIVIRGKHYLFFKPINESAKLFRDLSQRLFMQPLITFSPLTQSETDYRNKFQTSYSALNKELPQNIHLLSLEQWKKNQILVRLEHFYESVDNNDLSKAIEVDLENLLKPFKILNLTEMTLTANEVLSQTHRMKWNSNQYSVESKSIPNRIVRDINFKIQLSPQQIRTFIITIEDNKQNVEKCSLSWKHITGNQIPVNAITGGFDTNKSPFYVCRHTENNNTIPGNADTKSGCRVTKSEKVIDFKTDYEILIGENYDWVPRHGGDPVPKHSFVAAIDSKGSSIYIGRCDLHINSVETQVIGRIEHKFYYALNNTEHSDCNNHQILIC